MWPYTDDESAWLRDPDSQERRLHADWPTPETVEFYVRKGEQLRAEVTARALARCWMFLGTAPRRAWHAFAERIAAQSRGRSAT